MSSMISRSGFSTRGGRSLSSMGDSGAAWGGSMYGGAGGKGIKISMAGGAMGGLSSGYGFSGSSGGQGLGFGASFVENGSGGSAVTASEKQAMQNLNDRLARYLERVRTLEEANATLEAQIKEWGGGVAKVPTRDLGAYQATIDELRCKILDAETEVGKLLVNVENSQLAVDDFRIKYESEMGLRQSVEADVAGLKRALGDLALGRGDLELQLEGLKEEYAYMKTNHEEDMLSFRTQMGGQVQVEVEATPSIDLNGVIAEIREQYEGLVAKNRRDAENWFKSKADGVQQEMKSSTEVLQSTNVELKESTNTLRNLELELQALYSLKASLENNLAETQGRYSSILEGLQASVVSMENQMGQIRTDTERQGQDYRTLLNIKNRLEMEIAEYRRLLEGEIIGPCPVPSVEHSVSKVVSSSKSIKPVQDNSLSSTSATKVITIKTSERSSHSASPIVETSGLSGLSTRSTVEISDHSSRSTEPAVETSGLSSNSTLTTIEISDHSSRSTEPAVETSGLSSHSTISITETSEISGHSTNHVVDTSDLSNHATVSVTEMSESSSDSPIPAVETSDLSTVSMISTIETSERSSYSPIPMTADLSSHSATSIAESYGSAALSTDDCTDTFNGEDSSSATVITKVITCTEETEELVISTSMTDEMEEVVA